MDTHESFIFLLIYGFTMRQTIATIVNYILMFLGYGGVALLLYGSFKKAIFSSDEAKSKDAKMLIKIGVISLVVVLFLYGIAAFFLDSFG